MIKIETEQGELVITSGDVLMLLPEDGAKGSTMIFTELFPEGLLVKMAPEEIYSVVEQQSDWDVEIIEECTFDLGDGEEHY